VAEVASVLVVGVVDVVAVKVIVAIVAVGILTLTFDLEILPHANGGSGEAASVSARVQCFLSFCL